MDFTGWDEIRQHLSCTPLFAKLLWNRGFHSAEAVDSLLKPQLSALPSPFTLIDMEKAVERVIEAIANEEPIAVYGDYDVDGTCGASILFEFFREIQVPVVVYQPNRFKEGYGLHTAATRALIQDQGIRVLISVDCGITAVEPAKICRENGADLIVLDHHLPGPILPDALAIVDPQRNEDSSQLKNLCGAGIAFFFAMALRARLRDSGYFEDLGGEPPPLLKYLDLVAAATVADLADIRGANRILVSHGLRVLNRSPRVGIKSILETAGVKQVRSFHLGFVVGPRINAAGRLQSADAAFKLLTCQDQTAALDLARKLEDVNSARKETQNLVWEQAREQARVQIDDPMWAELSLKIPAAQFGPWPRALVLASEHWHEGVVGIVASKIVEEWGRPVFILSQKEGEPVWKGSARSISSIDIFQTLQTPSISQHLLNFGGHAHAGGASLRMDELQNFKIALNEHLALTTTAEQYKRIERFDLELDALEATPRMWAQLLLELENLEPFGMKFPEPVFRLKNARVEGLRVLKEKHQKFQTSGIDALWFNSVREGMPALEESSTVALWVSPQWNEWQGSKKLQFKINFADRGATQGAIQ